MTKGNFLKQAQSFMSDTFLNFMVTLIRKPQNEDFLNVKRKLNNMEQVQMEY